MSKAKRDSQGVAISGETGSQRCIIRATEGSARIPLRKERTQFSMIDQGLHNIRYLREPLVAPVCDADS